MKPLLSICLVLLFTGCAQVDSRPAMHPSSMLNQSIMDRETVSKRHARIEHSSVIDSRAKHFEKEGLSTEDARTAAEIEYAKSGR